MDQVARIDFVMEVGEITESVEVRGETTLVDSSTANRVTHMSAGIPPRRIDVRALQKHSVEVGNLPAEALEHNDSFLLPEEVPSQRS